MSLSYWTSQLQVRQEFLPFFIAAVVSGLGIQLLTVPYTTTDTRLEDLNCGKYQGHLAF